MSNEFDICAHPENELPLRAWLIEKRQIVEIGAGVCLELHSYKQRLNVYGPNGDVEEYVIGREAILLRPTGIPGLKTCPGCNGLAGHGYGLHEDGGYDGVEPCAMCKGTGKVKAPIYQADVVLYRRGTASDPRLTVLVMRTTKYGEPYGQGKLPLHKISVGPEDIERGNPVVICSLFNYPTTPKPDEVSDDEDWAFVGEQHKALMVSLESKA